MKFSSQFIFVCLTTGAYSRSIVERESTAVTGVLSQVQSGIDNVDTTVKAFNGDLKPLISASQRLVSTINSGTRTVQRSSDLTLLEALALLQPVKRLQSHGQTLSNDSKTKRPEIQTAKQCRATRDQVESINTASQELIKAIVGKVPNGAQDIAASQAAGITKVLGDAAANFAPGRCTDAV